IVASIGRPDLNDGKLLLVSCRSVQNTALRRGDLAISDVSEPLLAASLLIPDTVGRDAEDTILQAAGDHGVRTMRQHEVRRVTDNIGPLERQRSGRLR